MFFGKGGQVIHPAEKHGYKRIKRANYMEALCIITFAATAVAVFHIGKGILEIERMFKQIKLQ